MNFKNSNCVESKTQMVTKLRNSNYDKPKKSNSDKNQKIQIVTKLEL